VVAAAEGIVVDDGDLGGWNGGYGNYLIIEHPNGSKTRYAHLEKIRTSIGTVVSQGEQIGTVGNTGKVHGTTGCHLHFEVVGMANPFAKR
jgi:murein DD-endopeptidase MepM/ murein hydrolase activator NlpD